MIAAVHPRRPGELPGVPVIMTCRAGKLAGDVNRILPLGVVALIAAKPAMLAFQRKLAEAVGLDGELRWLEAGFVVAGRTIRTGRGRRKLPAVRILMAILTALVRDGFPEIAALVALFAGQRRMLAGQGKIRAAVSETRADMLVLPPGCVVAALAGAPKLGVLKGPVMRIHVAALAAGESNAFEQSRLFTLARHVAFLAGDQLVQSRELKGRTAMIEPGSWTPAFLAMTPVTVAAELPAVLVFMAERALPAQPQVRLV